MTVRVGVTGRGGGRGTARRMVVVVARGGGRDGRGELPVGLVAPGAVWDGPVPQRRVRRAVVALRAGGVRRLGSAVAMGRRMRGDASRVVCGARGLALGLGPRGHRPLARWDGVGGESGVSCERSNDSRGGRWDSGETGPHWGSSPCWGSDGEEVTDRSSQERQGASVQRARKGASVVAPLHTRELGAPG